jgi:hypothetical protein
VPEAHEIMEHRPLAVGMAAPTVVPGQNFVRVTESVILEHAMVALLSRMLRAVPIQSLNPDVLMMEPAEDWHRCNAAGLLRPPKIWSVFVR